MSLEAVWMPRLRINTILLALWLTLQLDHGEALQPTRIFHQLPSKAVCFRRSSVFRDHPTNSVGGTQFQAHSNTENDIFPLPDSLNQTSEATVVLEPSSVERNGALEASPKNATVVLVDFEVPSVLRILSFAIPAIGVWLCSPLLAMIDTSVVGVLSGTAQQAALNPAVAVTDYSARCMSFLYTGATSILALQMQTQQQTNQQPSSASQEAKTTDPSLVSQTFLGALQLGLWVGSGLAVFLLIMAPVMLQGLIGNKGVDPAVMTAALRYVRIRAMGMPAAAMIGVALASCLGLKDVKSPLQAITAAAVVNLVLDLALVGQPQSWLGGAAGAAWATTLSQYFALTLCLRSLGRKRDPTSRSTVTASTTHGILSPFHLKSPQTWLAFPKSSIWSKFRPFVLPVTTTQVGRCSTYVAMGHVVSSCLGTNNILAANQIVTAILYTLIPISDSLGLTAQSFLPSLLSQKDSPSKSRALRKTTFNLLKAALIFGATLSTFVGSMPLFLNIFTSDIAVQSLVKEIIPILTVCFALHGIFCGSEGILLAHQDLSFLGRMYGLFFLVVPAAFLRMKHLALTGKAAIGLSTVWNGFFCYHLFRIACWVARVIQLQRKTHTNGKNELETQVAS